MSSSQQNNENQNMNIEHNNAPPSDQDPDEQFETDSQQDIVYLDEEQIQALDEDQEGDGGDDDFLTMQESEFNEQDGMAYGEGEIINQQVIQNDSFANFFEHKDSIFGIAVLPKENFDIFISGDCNDKALVWKLNKSVQQVSTGEEQKDGDLQEKEVYETQVLMTIPHTETVEFTKFNFDGKLLATGGMNNPVRIWNSEKNFELQATLDGPSDDINFVEWHPKGNVILLGGKDMMIWMFNAQNGQYVNSFSGHQKEVLQAKFSLNDGGKHIISSSADATIKVWSPMKATCLQTIKNNQQTGEEAKFHTSEIDCFAIHHERPLLISGDLEGKVFYCNYLTGEVGTRLGTHTDSVESICMSQHLPLAVSAGIDITINIYDLTKFELRHKVQPSEYGAYTKVSYSQIYSHIVYAASTLGDFFLIDSRDGTTIKQYRGHQAPINDFIEVKERQFVVTAGDDRLCLLFDVKNIQ